MKVTITVCVCVHIQFAIVVSYHLVCGNYTKRHTLPMVKIENINSQRLLWFESEHNVESVECEVNRKILSKIRQCVNRTHKHAYNHVQCALVFRPEFELLSIELMECWESYGFIERIAIETCFEFASTHFFPLLFSILFCSQLTFVRSILPGEMCLVHTRANILSKHLWVHNSFNRWTSFCVTAILLCKLRCSLFGARVSRH